MWGQQPPHFTAKEAVSSSRRTAGEHYAQGGLITETTCLIICVILLFVIIRKACLGPCWCWLGYESRSLGPLALGGMGSGEVGPGVGVRGGVSAVGSRNGAPTSGNSESVASSWASSAVSVPHRPSSRTCNTSGRTWNAERSGTDRCRERQKQKEKHREGKGERGKETAGQWAVGGGGLDHILVLRERFKGQIPSQHTLTRVGIKLFITKDDSGEPPEGC